MPTMLRVSLALAVALATNCNAAPALAAQYHSAATSCDFPSVKPHTRGTYRHHLELVRVGGRVSTPQDCAEVCCVHPECRAYAFQVVDRSSGKPTPNICITYSSTEVPAWESSVEIDAKYDFYTRPAEPKGAATPALGAETAAAAVTPTAAASAPEPEPTATDAPATDAPAMAMEDADHTEMMVLTFGEDHARPQSLAQSQPSTATHNPKPPKPPKVGVVTSVPGVCVCARAWLSMA